MSGEPVAACKQLTRKALKKLREGDTFRLIHFSNSASMFSRDALPATPQNIERALSYLDGLSGGGGTEMLEGVRAALDAPKDPNRLRMVLFLTDGYIGNEAQIVGRASSSLGDARIFALGIGKSVNRFLLDRLAEAGRGVAEYLRPGESPDSLVDRFYERIADPVFTQVELDWGDLDVVDVEPRQLRDLFASQPLLVHARYRSGGRGIVTLSGFAGSKRREIEVEIRLPKMETKNQAQANLWARARIARLEMDKMRTGNQKVLIEEITELALEHRLMTAYTSFVAVLQSEIRDDGKLVTLDQPVPMPEGVSFERVFGDRDQASRQTPGAASLNSVSRMASPRTSKAPAAAGSPKSMVDYGRSVADENMVLSVPDPLPLRIPGGPADGVANWEHKTEAVEVTRPRDSNQNAVSQVEINPSEPAEIPAPFPVQATDRPAGVVPPVAISSDRDSGPNRAVTSTAQPNTRGWSVEIDLPLLAASMFLLLLTACAWYMRRVTIV